jgi:hypothetical protein
VHDRARVGLPGRGAQPGGEEEGACEEDRWGAVEGAD